MKRRNKEPGNRTKRDLVVSLLRWALGLVLLAQSLILAFHQEAIQNFAQYGYPDWVRLVLAWSEIIASVLFLTPRLFWLGAGALFIVLTGALVLHLALGESPGFLVVYLLILVAILVLRRSSPSGTHHAAPASEP